MHHSRQTPSAPSTRTVLLLAAVAIVAAGSLVMSAAEAAEPSAAQRYEQERAACLAGRSNQDRSTCLKEADAALAEARRGRLVTDVGAQADNAGKRCQALPAAERVDCLDRMRGAGMRSGTAASGGIYRETVTIMPAASAASAAVR